MIMMEARHRKRLTQCELAELSGISQTQISKIESGYVFPQINTQAKIEQILGKVDFIATRRQRPCYMGFPENESQEDAIYRTISIYLKSGQTKDRAIRIKFLKQFIQQLEIQSNLQYYEFTEVISR
jgi:transcriptional regulator with XRE-family HTH domain